MPIGNQNSTRTRIARSVPKAVLRRALHRFCEETRAYWGRVARVALAGVRLAAELMHFCGEARRTARAHNLLKAVLLRSTEYVPA